MKQQGMTGATIFDTWILSRLWERFLAAANKWNLHIFVAVGTPWRRDGYRYIQPDFLDYTAKQLETASNLAKGTLTILERHRDMCMILTSGEEVEVAIRNAKDTLLMIEDGAPARFRCELCSSEGTMTAFRTQEQLVKHYQEVHQN